MSYVLRTEGQQQFYTVEWLTHWPKTAWIPAGDNQIARIPEALRFGPLVNGHHKFLEPTRSFQANGEVWQLTGNNGFYSLAQAAELLELLVKHDPQNRYRLVRVEMSLTITSLAELGSPKEKAAA